jgi:hypothetical protein
MSDENDRQIRSIWDFVFRILDTIIHTSNRKAIEAIGLTFVFVSFIFLAIQINTANTAKP